MTILLVMPLIELPVYSAGLDPYNTVLCSSFDEEISLHTRANFAVTASQVSAIWPTDYLGFKDLDFGKWGPNKVTFTSGAREGMASMIQLRLDAPDGELIAEVPVTQINFQTGVANTVPILAEIKGVHDLYVTTNQSTADLFSFCFYTEDPDKFTYKDFSINRAYQNMSNDFTGNAANILWQLGIMTGEEGKNLDANMPVSRAEFADVIYGIYNKRNPGNSSAEPEQGIETKFYDVTAQSPYSNAISYLTQIGVINGITETEFKPNEYIKYIDAVTILVRMLGYTEIAELRGGYPLYYIQMADDLGFYDSDIDTDDVLRRGSMADLVFKALKSDYLEIVGIVDPDYAVHDTKKGVLGKTQKVYSDIGIVEATEISSLTMPKTSMGRNAVMIDGITYDVGKTDAIGFLGIECEYFYEVDSKTGGRTLRAIAPNRKTEMLEISSLVDEITEISDSKISYILNGETKEEEIEISKKAYILYNGVAADSSIELLVNESDFKGTIIAAENIDGSQSIIINEYADYVIESINYATGKITGQSDKGDFTLSDKDLSVIYDENNEELILKQLKSGDILTVYQSKNKTGKKFSKVYLSNSSVSGSITEIDESDYYINDKKYKLSNNCVDKINVGQSGVFLLNIYGEIVKVGTDSDSSLIVGLFMAYDQKPMGVDDTVMFKLMTLDGKTSSFKAARRVNVDGTQCKTAGEIVSVVSGLEEETAVRYRLNAAGEIDLIDTPNKNDGSYTNRLTLLNPDDTASYGYNRRSELLYDRTSGGTGAVKYILSKNATVFEFFGIDDREENCVVGRAEEIVAVTSDKLNGKFYSTIGDEMHYIDLVVWEDSIYSMTLSDESLFVVDEISEKIGEDGVINKVLRGWSGGERVEYIINENAVTNDIKDTDTANDRENKKETFKNIMNNLKTGDVLRFETGASKDIRTGALLLLCDGAESRATSTTPIKPTLHKNKRSSGSSGNLEDHLCFGEIIEKYDNYIVIDTGNGQTEVANISSGSFALVCKNADGKPKIKSGLTANNLNEGDVVIAHIDQGFTASIVIFDDITF